MWHFWAEVAHYRGLSGGSGTLGRRAHCEGFPAAFCSEEYAEWRANIGAADVIVSDLDVGKDGLVEFAAGGFAGVKVKFVIIEGLLHGQLTSDLVSRQGLSGRMTSYLHALRGL